MLFYQENLGNYYCKESSWILLLTNMREEYIFSVFMMKKRKKTKAFGKKLLKIDETFIISKIKLKKYYSIKYLRNS